MDVPRSGHRYPSPDGTERKIPAITRSHSRDVSHRGWWRIGNDYLNERLNGGKGLFLTLLVPRVLVLRRGSTMSKSAGV